MGKKKLVFNEKTGEFEERNSRKGCGCAIAFVIVAIAAYAAYMFFIA